MLITDTEGKTTAEAYGKIRKDKQLWLICLFFIPAKIIPPELQVVFDQICLESCAVFFFFLLAGIAFCSSNPVNGIHFACNEAAAPTSRCLACVSSSEEDARAGIKLH